MIRAMQESKPLIRFVRVERTPGRMMRAILELAAAIATILVIVWGGGMDNPWLLPLSVLMAVLFFWDDIRSRSKMLSRKARGRPVR